MVINSLNISDDELKETVGSGLYLSASALNHSCEPNCIITFVGSRLKVTALKRIELNEEPLISYIELICAKTERQEQLQRLYYFKCECQRCSSNSIKVISFKWIFSIIHV